MGLAILVTKLMKMTESATTFEGLVKNPRGHIVGLLCKGSTKEVQDKIAAAFETNAEAGAAFRWAINIGLFSPDQAARTPVQKVISYGWFADYVKDVLANSITDFDELYSFSVEAVTPRFFFVLLVQIQSRDGVFRFGDIPESQRTMLAEVEIANIEALFEADAVSVEYSRGGATVDSGKLAYGTLRTISLVIKRDMTKFNWVK